MENEKSLELIPTDTSKKLEKHSKPIPITNIQEIMENMTTSLKIEEITKNSKNILKNLQPTIQTIKKTNANFSHNIKPVLEQISIIQRDFLNSIQSETLQNIKNFLSKATENELEALIEEACKDIIKNSSVKQSSKTSKLNKIVHEAQQKALLDLQKPYIAMLNGPATNQLTNINTNYIPPTIDIITGNATIEKGTLKVFIDKYSELKGVRTSTLKLLDTFTMYLTNQNHYRGNDKDINPTITISLEQYMKLCGIPLTKSSKDKTRRKVKEDLETLYHISLEWTEPIGNKTKDFAKMRICDKISVMRGNITFSFSKNIAKYLTNAYIMQYPMELLKIDERNGNTYPLGRKLLLHQSINNNKKKKTYDIISVKSGVSKREIK